MIDPKIDEETLSITFPAASGEPYERYDKELNERYYERLVCTPEAVNLDRLNGGASILKNHDPDDILGKVEKAWIEEGKLVIRARFRRNSFGAIDTFRDIVDGTLPNVSIGYFPEVVVPVIENGVNFRDVTRWTVFEVSVAVGVPADPTVGFYRSLDLKTKGNTMAEEKEKTCGEEAKAEPAEEEAKAAPCGEEKAEPSADEAEKACSEEEKEEPSADKVEEEEAPKAETRAAELRIRVQPAGEIRSYNIPQTKGNTYMSDRKYSLTRAFQSLVNPRIDATLERSTSDSLYRSMGYLPEGGSLMVDLGGMTRDGEFIDAAGNGAGLVGTEHRGDLFVEALRTRMGVKNARIITGLRTPIQIPVQTGVSTIGIKDIDAAVDRTKPTVTSIEMSPKKFGAETVIGKSLLMQGNPDAIALVVNDLEAEIARKLDTTILHGDAGQNIAGVDGTTGVQTQTIASLSTITWGDVTAMYGKIADYEIEDGSLEWIAKGPTKAIMMSIPKEAHTGRFLCDEDGTVGGYQLNVCGRCSADDLYFGYWPAVYIGQWGGLEIGVDPYTGMSSGSIKIVATLYADVAITKPVAFVKRVSGGSN